MNARSNVRNCAVRRVRRTVPTIRLCSLLTCVALTACESVVQQPTRLDSAEYLATTAPAKYLIRPGDQLEVRFFHTPDLNATFPVRPDGYISLPYAREVQAAGKTPEEVATILTERYGQELRDPEIAVLVLLPANAKIHVGGRVREPGVFPLTGSMTVLQSLFEAGGFEAQARLDEVVVIRQSLDNSFMVIPVNLRTVLDGTDVSQNIALQPFDMGVVPNSPIAEVNNWVDLYVRQNIPINFGVAVRPAFAF